MFFTVLLSALPVDASIQPYKYSSVCANPQPLSCHLNSTNVNTCCSPQPGGLTLTTQFWDTYTGTASKLPARSWTLHGLWPDNCNGSYQSYCDASRNITGEQLTSIILNYGRADLLSEMNKFWVNQGGPNSDLQAHEYAKHATCTSTFDAKCYAGYRNGSNAFYDVVDYAETALAYFHTHPTYQFLESSGIVPSNTTTYNLTQLQNAAKAGTGFPAYFGCSANPAMNGTKNILSEVWYFGYVRGRVQDLRFEAIDNSPFTNSSCAASGIRYPLRSNGTEIDVISGQYI